jgi:hypothetical protein
MRIAALLKGSVSPGRHDKQSLPEKNGLHLILVRDGRILEANCAAEEAGGCARRVLRRIVGIN